MKAPRFSMTKIGLAVGSLIPEIRVLVSEAVVDDSGTTNLAIKFDRLV